MWKDSNRNIVVIFQTNILRIVGFYVRHSAYVYLFQTWTLQATYTGSKNEEFDCYKSIRNYEPSV